MYQRQTVLLADIGYVQSWIVAYSLGRRANGNMVAQMLDKAFGRLKERTPLLHANQGVLYRTDAYREKLAEQGIMPSRSRTGSCWDNAPRECFFATLKTEGCYQEAALSVVALSKEIED